MVVSNEGTNMSYRADCLIPETPCIHPVGVQLGSQWRSKHCRGIRPTISTHADSYLRHILAYRSLDSPVSLDSGPIDLPVGPVNNFDIYQGMFTFIRLVEAIGSLPRGSSLDCQGVVGTLEKLGSYAKNLVRWHREWLRTKRTACRLHFRP